MQRKLTITVSEEVYRGLHAKIGRGRISKFLDSLARRHVVEQDLAKAYKAMAEDLTREADALEWSENLARLGNLWVDSGSCEGSIEVAAEFAAGGLKGSLLFF